MLDTLKKEVFEANLELVKQSLVIYTWGNVSARDKDTNYIVIKPSGISYDVMKASDMVIVDLNGCTVEGKYKPSSDMLTHIELYRHDDNIMGVVHTHSEWATSWAQAGRDLPCYGTTHADYFYGDIPCTRALNRSEIEGEYERNTGSVILETIVKRGYTITDIPGIIVKGHGPFTWGKSALEAVHNAKVMEEIAKMAFRTEHINPTVKKLEQCLLDKHYNRKHGKHAYYGQK